MSAETNYATNKQLAELVGWRFEFAYTASDDDGKVIQYFRVYDPQGELICFEDMDGCCRDDEHAEWALPFAIPNFMENGAAALSLKVEGYMLRLHQVVDGWRAYYVHVDTDIALTVYGNRIDATEQEALNPAEAICKSRLALVEYMSV